MEKTKAQQLIEVASWVKVQNPEFTKHFKSMRAIIKFYLQLPESYDRKKSVVAYIKSGLKSSDFITSCKARRLSLIINAFFGFRYIKEAPYKWKLYFGFRKWTDRNGKEHMEVYCTCEDMCNIYDDFKEQVYGNMTIAIKSLGDAKRAADKLLADQISRVGDDYETIYGLRLQEVMKEENPTEEVLTEACEVRI
jgi:hypothetical protein